MNTAPQRKIMEPYPPLLLADSCKFRVRTLEDCLTLSPFLALMFRDPERVKNGIFDLLINAVEHGCLNMGHETKGVVMANGTWKKEIHRRQSLPENREKFATVITARKPEGIFLVVNDPGAGFDWQRWVTLDPARAERTHGRGIARARHLCFDALTYNETGTQAVAQSRDLPEQPW